MRNLYISEGEQVTLHAVIAAFLNDPQKEFDATEYDINAMKKLEERLWHNINDEYLTPQGKVFRPGDSIPTWK